MARPKKNVEIKEEKKEIKRKGRPRKVEVGVIKPNKTKTISLKERVAKLEDELAFVKNQYAELSMRVKDVHMDLNDVCDEQDKKDTDFGKLIGLINEKENRPTKKVEVRVNNHRIDTDRELEEAIDDLVDTLFKVFR